MRFRKIMVAILLIFAFTTPVVMPKTSTVASAKVYECKSLNTLRKKFKKIKSGMTLKKVNKILGRKPTDVVDSFSVNDVITIQYVWAYTFRTKKDGDVMSVEIKIMFSDGTYSAKNITEYY